MIDRIDFTEIAGKVSGVPPDRFRLDFHVAIQVEGENATISVNFLVDTPDPDTRSRGTNEPETNRFFVGKVTCVVSGHHGSDVDEPSLISEAWPAISTTMNDHGRRLGATWLRVPHSISVDMLRQAHKSQ